MKKLMLSVMIKFEGFPTVHTACRVFDSKSHYAADRAIRSGCLGSYRRTAFYLSGSFIDTEEGTNEMVVFPFYRQTAGKTKLNVLNVPEVLKDFL